MTESGRRRIWNKKLVKAAEEHPHFQARRIEPRKTPAQGAGNACKLLSQAWEDGGLEETASDAAILAKLIHRGLLALLPGVAKGRSLASSRAQGWIKEFLALEERGDSKSLPIVLKNFLKAGGWMGEREGAPLVRKVQGRYPQVLLASAGRALEDLAAAQPEADLSPMLRTPGFPADLLVKEGLTAVWSVWYVPQAIRTSLSLLIALNPKDEYPEARAMRRHFTLHLGGTNTGKTYAGFQRLKQARSGVYLAPLRLLALEAQETLLDAGVDCSLTTG